ncbi:MAG: nickel-responsive transcriptional regulator NikR [Candidatus Marinimicrobia bacterium]|nr:nickel-responsive transcriptional regulator NikR [Candidatus Neomarinimicrobiota bacterium]
MAKDTKRFGVSLPKGLLKKFDKKIQNEGYNNRSEAIRDLIRDSFLEDKIADDQEVAGTLTIIFDHDSGELSHQLESIQHEYYQKIISKLHIHLDQTHCLEVIVLKGKSKKVKAIAKKIITLRGVKHGKLTFSYSGHK